MPLAKEVAQELRRVADALDKDPDTEILPGELWFSANRVGGSKKLFLNTAKILPRPLKKRIAFEGEKYAQVYFDHDTPALNTNARIDQSDYCIIKEPARPAVYECPSLLSEEEEASLVEP